MTTHVLPTHRPTVVVTSRDDVRRDVTATVEKEGMTLDEFVRRGESDDLSDDRLRSLWLLVRSALR